MEDNKLAKSLSQKRFWLSIIIIGISLVLLLLAMYSIDAVEWKTVFTAIIGLVGTWVGTVLAFYFTKENFDAASASTQKLVDSITTKEKLNSIKVKEAMIPLSGIKYLKLDPDKKLTEYFLVDVLKKHLSEHNRLPILKTDGTIYGIAHKSLIVEFIAEQVISGQSTQDLNLQLLMDNRNYGDRIRKGYSSVKENDSLITAKTLMENLSVGKIICSDIFVTKDGTIKTEVIGWITNIEITKNLDV